MTSVCKNFILEEEITQNTQVIPFVIDLAEKQFSLIQVFKSKIEDCFKCEYRIYDLKKNQYINLYEIAKQGFTVSTDFLNQCQNIVLIKYRKQQSQTTNSYRQQLDDFERKSLSSQASSRKKDERSKERVIGNVILLVKQWRNLHSPVDKTQRKLSLQEAAKLLGMKKKSLDDYYYQLRLGEKYGFNFQKYINEKIGILRTFLKEKAPRLGSQSSDKISKTLKIFEQIDFMNISVPQSQNLMKQQFDNRKFQNNKKQQQMIFEENEQSGEVKVEIQFYEDFGYMDIEHDPFLNLDKKFKKKKDDQIFDEELFF